MGRQPNFGLNVKNDKAPHISRRYKNLDSHTRRGLLEESLSSQSESGLRARESDWLGAPSAGKSSKNVSMCRRGFVWLAFSTNTERGNTGLPYQLSQDEGNKEG